MLGRSHRKAGRRQKSMKKLKATRRQVLRYAMLCYAMLCYAMLCYAMLCYAMLCYAILYAMPCHAMPCYALQVCPALLLTLLSSIPPRTSYDNSSCRSNFSHALSFIPASLTLSVRIWICMYCTCMQPCRAHS